MFIEIKILKTDLDHVSWWYIIFVKQSIILSQNYFNILNFI